MRCPRCLRVIPDKAQICMFCNAKVAESETDIIVPEELNDEEKRYKEAEKGLNFGAFILAPLWALAYRQWIIAGVLFAPLLFSLVILLSRAIFGENSAALKIIALVLIIPSSVLGLAKWIVPFYLLFDGNRIAWQSGRFKTIGEMKEEQKSWAIFGLLILAIILIVVIFILIAENVKQ